MLHKANGKTFKTGSWWIRSIKMIGNHETDSTGYYDLGREHHKNNTKNRENGQDLKIRSEDDQRKRIQTRKIPRDEESKQERFR